MLQRIGKYEILEQIGRGGQGTVYRARDTGLDRIVAIKVIDQSVADDPGYLDALRREAQLAANLDHPNIVTVHAFEVENDTPYIVMEYVPHALDRQIRSGRLEPRRAVAIAEQVCRGLAHAHELGVVHRDIKPANILLTANGDAKISDFGIARAIASSTRAPRTSAAGTYAYLPPEQWEENPAVDRRSDIYALGVTLFEVLAGTVPFTGNSVIEVHRQHQQDPVPQLPRNVRAPSGLGDVIQKAMAKRPELRFQTAGDMAVALGGLFGTSGGGRRTSSASSPTPPVVPPGPPVASGSGSGRVGGIPSWLLFGGLGAIVMAVIAIVVAMSVSGGEGNGKTIQVVIPSDTSDTPEPTVNIDATVEAGIQQGLAERPTPAAKVEVATPTPTVNVVVATPAAGSSAAFVSKWGTYGTGDGQFGHQSGVAVAPDGSVYVADTWNHRIQKFTSEGVFVTKWGTEGTVDGQFDFPRGVAVAADGSVYVADSSNHRIQKFTVGP